MKKVLYFFPLNLIKQDAGSIQRARSLVSFFRERGMVVDYVYSNDFFGGSPISVSDVNQLKKKEGINQVFCLRKRPFNKLSFDYFFKYKIHKIVRSIFRPNHLPSFVTPYSQEIFNRILQRNDYDYIIISYVYWAYLIKHNRLIKRATTIVDTHDFISSQNLGNIKIGLAVEEEIKRLNFFDEVWTVSTDERYLFGQFVNNEIRHVPIAFDSKEILFDQKKYDIIYVAGDNPHNIKAITWFFDKVYPKLESDLKICVIGKIERWIPNKTNVEKIRFADDLEFYYRQARVAICPMLSGTGVKVKVLEAMSYGLPIVCSPKGVDGLVNKTNNGCLVSNDPIRFVENINILLYSHTKYKEVQQQAIRFFKDNYSTSKLYEILDEAFQLKSDFKD